MATTLKLKVNDLVRVLSGRDRGKQGKVTQVFPRQGLAVVEGVNIRLKQIKTRSRGQAGSRVQFSAPLPVSKLQVICSQCSRPARVGMQVAADGSKVRICRRCQQPIVTTTA